MTGQKTIDLFLYRVAWDLKTVLRAGCSAGRRGVAGTAMRQAGPGRDLLQSEGRRRAAAAADEVGNADGTEVDLPPRRARQVQQ